MIVDYNPLQINDLFVVKLYKLFFYAVGFTQQIFQYVQMSKFCNYFNMFKFQNSATTSKVTSLNFPFLLISDVYMSNVNDLHHFFFMFYTI